MGRVEGKVAFITGAARGMGRSHAVRLAEEGADIIAVDLMGTIEGSASAPATEAEMAETVAQVESLGRRIIASKADVRDFESLEKAVNEGVEKLGRLDIVVASAGILTIPGPADQIPEDVYMDMININLNGVWRTAKAGMPHLRANSSGGSVILISSTAGLKGVAGVAHYVAAKHGVVGLMRTMAIEMADNMIRVNSVHPTNTNTPMIMNEKTYKMFRPELEHPTKDDFAPASVAFNTMPIPWVEPVDISNAVLFLASDESRFITGVTLPVDAGCLLK